MTPSPSPFASSQTMPAGVHVVEPGLMAQHSSRGLSPLGSTLHSNAAYLCFPLHPNQPAARGSSLLMLTSLGGQHSFPAYFMQPEEDTMAGFPMFLLQRGLL